MATIVLIRTGTTEYESQGRIQGTLDVPLSEDGRQQVEEAAAQLEQQALPITALYCGPCRCAQQTTEILGERLHLKPRTLDTLRNLNQGLWQGLLVEEVRSKQPRVYRQWQEQPETVCPPQGEMVHDARLRLQKVIDKLVKRHKQGTIAIVLPEPLASVLRALLTEAAVSDLWNAPIARGTGPLWEPIAVSPAR